MLFKPADNSYGPEILSPVSSSFPWAVICPHSPPVVLPSWGGLGTPWGLSLLPCNQSERSLLSITAQKLCKTLHCCCWSSEQRTRAGINPGLSHGNGSITFGPSLEDFILLRHRGHASLRSASLSFSSSSNTEIAKELKKASPANTQAEPLVNLHLASGTCWVKLLGVDKSV